MPTGSSTNPMPTHPSDFISIIVLEDDGIWRSRSETAVFYPDEGHDSCHAIEDRRVGSEPRMLRWEATALHRGHAVPFGARCILVATQRLRASAR